MDWASEFNEEGEAGSGMREFKRLQNSISIGSLKKSYILKIQQ